MAESTIKNIGFNTSVFTGTGERESDGEGLARMLMAGAGAYQKKLEIDEKVSSEQEQLALADIMNRHQKARLKDDAFAKSSDIDKVNWIDKEMQEKQDFYESSVSDYMRVKRVSVRGSDSTERNTHFTNHNTMLQTAGYTNSMEGVSVGKTTTLDDISRIMNTHNDFYGTNNKPKSKQTAFIDYSKMTAEAVHDGVFGNNREDIERNLAIVYGDESGQIKLPEARNNITDAVDSYLSSIATKNKAIESAKSDMEQENYNELNNKFNIFRDKNKIGEQSNSIQYIRGEEEIDNLIALRKQTQSSKIRAKIDKDIKSRQKSQTSLSENVDKTHREENYISMVDNIANERVLNATSMTELVVLYNKDNNGQHKSVDKVYEDVADSGYANIINGEAGGTEAEVKSYYAPFFNGTIDNAKAQAKLQSGIDKMLKDKEDKNFIDESEANVNIKSMNTKVDGGGLLTKEETATLVDNFKLKYDNCSTDKCRSKVNTEQAKFEDKNSKLTSFYNIAKNTNYINNGISDDITSGQRDAITNRIVADQVDSYRKNPTKENAVKLKRTSDRLRVVNPVMQNIKEIFTGTRKFSTIEEVAESEYMMKAYGDASPLYRNKKLQAGISAELAKDYTGGVEDLPQDKIDEINNRKLSNINEKVTTYKRLVGGIISDSTIEQNLEEIGDASFFAGNWATNDGDINLITAKTFVNQASSEGILITSVDELNNYVINNAMKMEIDFEGLGTTLSPTGKNAPIIYPPSYTDTNGKTKKVSQEMVSAFGDWVIDTYNDGNFLPIESHDWENIKVESHENSVGETFILLSGFGEAGKFGDVHITGQMINTIFNNPKISMKDLMNSDKRK